MELYSYSKNDLSYDLRFKKNLKSFSGMPFYKYELNFNSAYLTGLPKNDLVYCDFYSKKRIYRKKALKKTKDAPLIIFIHGFATSDKKIENYNYFIKKIMDFNANCLFVNLPFHLNRAPENEQSGKRLVYFDDKDTLLFFHQSVVDIRKSIDILESFVSFKEIYLLGISLGSMISAVTAAFEPKINKTVLALGGGNWEEVHWNGILKYILKGNCADEGTINRAKCHNYYLSFDDFSSKLKEKNPDKITVELEDNAEIKEFCTKKCFLCDPAAFAYKISPESVLMLNSRMDHFFSKKSTLKLWQSLGQPEIHWMSYPHVSKIISRKNIFERIVKFFNLKV